MACERFGFLLIVQISQSVFIGSTVTCLHDLCCQGHVTLSAQDFYLYCLQSENKDVCRAVLQCISTHQQHNDTVNTSFEVLFLNPNLFKVPALALA